MAERTAVALGPLVAALALLVVVLVGVTVWATPWTPLDVPGADRVAVEPARDFTAAERAREEEFNRRLDVPAYAALAVSLGLALVLGLTPLGARLVDLAGRLLGGGWLARTVLGTLLLLLLLRLATLPFGAWAEVLRRDYGLSTRTWGGWASDVARGFLVQAVVTTLVVVSVLALARWLPRWWFVPAALGGAALAVALSFVYPLVVEPLFNRFTPMPDGPLRTRLLELAEADGVPVEDVLVADASRRTTALNAYVSGFGATRRIVVYDTLLDAAPEAEVEVVVAHELGHAAERDVLVGTAVAAVGVAAGACVLALLLASRPLLERAGASGADDPRVIGLVLAVVAVGGFLVSPAQSLVSRRIEARADVHSLELTRDPLTFAQMQRRLAVTAISDLEPNAFDYVMFSSHPTAPQRLAGSRSWAQANGLPPPPDLAP